MKTKNIIKTKYNVGDLVFIPVIEFTPAYETYGVVIKKEKINKISFNGKNIHYHYGFADKNRIENFVYDNYEDAKKHAYKMIKKMAEDNKDRLEPVYE